MHDICIIRGSPNGKWDVTTAYTMKCATFIYGNELSAHKQQSLEIAYTIMRGLNSLYLGIHTKAYMPAVGIGLKTKGLEAKGENEREMS